ncbi:BCD1 [Candida jiufengensis]|uniref:BCD1 n=1 Tax=Candida jiufengensis TaxID=497108 RepID=UPI0022244BF6|nr:BCD1 [Candida jiufengensis]KAI5952348.1 BCD1 [Candida jiufengensis]
MNQPEGKCSICQTNQYKYTCPACETKSCSLNCYKQHQTQSSCTGKVDNTKFIKQEELSQNSVHLNRDYNFLLQVDRKIHLSKEDLKTNAKHIFKRSRNDLQPNRKRFKKSTEDSTDQRKIAVDKTFNDPQTKIIRENTMVIQLPTGMQRASSNKTGYDKKSNTFVWTIEWKLLANSGKELTTFTSFRLKENLILKDSIPMNILNNHEWKDKNNLKFYIKNVLNTPKDSVIELDENATIGSALKDKIVLEYPTIYVTQGPDVLQNKVLVEKEAYQLEDTSSDANSSSSSSEDDSSDNSHSSSEDSDSNSDSDGGPEESTSKPPILNKKFEDDEVDIPKAVDENNDQPIIETVSDLQDID